MFFNLFVNSHFSHFAGQRESHNSMYRPKVSKFLSVAGNLTVENGCGIANIWDCALVYGHLIVKLCRIEVNLDFDIS